MIKFFHKIKISDVKFSVIVSAFLTILLTATGLDEILQEDNTLKGYLIDIFLMSLTFFIIFFIGVLLMALAADYEQKS